MALEKQGRRRDLIEVIADESVDLLTVASAADVVAAEARFNLWVGQVAKGTRDVLALVDPYDDAESDCRRAIAAFRSDRNQTALRAALLVFCERTLQLMR